ncbi:transcriptional regulator [Oxalobacteraceae bacterium CAVE-383]|nr:transcriptional regulator [Oxalobacteraceae bacterium CAVE-383]
MTSDYPIRFTAQLRQHLKAFRAARNLTQAQLGDLVGVSQARIAEIEADPGLVKFDQLMQLLSALEITISLREDGDRAAHDDVPVGRPKKGAW